MTHKPDKHTQAPSEPELSRSLSLEKIGKEPVTRTITATPEECAALAKRAGVESFDKIQADISVRRQANSSYIKVWGTLEASVTQLCVRSLKPIVQEIKDSFEAFFTDDDQLIESEKEAMRATQERLMPSYDGDDPEFLFGETLDLGEVIAQQLIVNLDPYPRAVESNLPAAEGAPQRTDNPFRVLETLKQKTPPQK